VKARTNLLISKSGLSAFLIKELREVVPPTIFFAVGFNLILLTTKLILSDYRVEFSSFMIATMMALVVGKSVLVANAMQFLRRFDTAPKIRPVLFKSIVYWAVVFLVRFARRTECALRSWGAREDFFHRAFIGNEADAARSGFERSSGSPGTSKRPPSMSLLGLQISPSMRRTKIPG
jgi:hypothetical protein